jgi:hypothetical protein
MLLFISDNSNFVSIFSHMFLSKDTITISSQCWKILHTGNQFRPPPPPPPPPPRHANLANTCNNSDPFLTQ